MSFYAGTPFYNAKTGSDPASSFRASAPATFDEMRRLWPALGMQIHLLSHNCSLRLLPTVAPTVAPTINRPHSPNNASVISPHLSSISTATCICNKRPYQRAFLQPDFRWCQYVTVFPSCFCIIFATLSFFASLQCYSLAAVTVLHN